MMVEVQHIVMVKVCVMVEGTVCDGGRYGV